ncbi:MAG TPA: ABC transporter ATP-binding protein [Gaiellaceae bacterium]|nr:ABC transporter ATP-binding protein [Gaiellaceae bacterium]
MSVAIRTEGLSKRYRIGELQSTYGTLRDSLAGAARRLVQRDHRPHYEEIWALRDASLEVPEGQVLGVIGRNGAGKSTLLRILTRITTPTSGRAEIRGRVGSLLEVGTGFHPELTGRENVFLNGSVLGMKQREIQGKFDEIVEFAGVEQFIDTPVKRYSSGMSVRLAFAVAAHLEPEILLVDEVLAVGDAEFQRRCLGRMEDLSDSGRTVVFVSHQMQAVSQLCDRAILLEKGSVTLDGPSGDVVAHYLQRVGGAGSSRSWPDVASAPGDDLARLLSVRVVDEHGDTADATDVRRPVGIEIGFRVLRSGGPAVFPKIKVYNARRNVVFNALDTSSRWREPSPPGEYVSTAWIPGNLLNEGLATVDVGICSLSAPKLHPHAGCVDAISFHVQDEGEGDSARGLFTGQLQGVVRPLLEWTTDER